MKAPAPCLVYSPDAELVRRLDAYLSALAPVRTADTPRQLDRLLRQYNPALVMVDLRTRDGVEQIGEVKEQQPDSIIIALGDPRSEPALQAEALGVYAVEETNCERKRLQSLVARGLDYLAAIHPRPTNGARPPDPGHPAPARPAPSSMPRPLRDFARAIRKFANVDALMDDIVEGIASTLLVSRAGLFLRGRDDGKYRLRAGLRCLEETDAVEFTDRDPLLRWLERRACMIHRTTLDHAAEPAERKMLQQALDQLGAEMIIPLHGRGRILGWIFVGHLSTGRPFDQADLEELLALAEHSATILENALLYEEVTLQKTLAETVLQSMPTGLVAINPEGVIQWFNRAAGDILETTADRVINQRIEKLNTRLADQLRRAVAGEELDARQEWKDPATRRPLSVQTRQLRHRNACLGAVALIHDLTNEKQLREKEERLERAAFWTDLAASISHEVRNPLVAIKTFAQLLPERYGDEEFRVQFSHLVALEVDRLNGIIEQINDFAHPPKLSFKPVDFDHTIRKGLDLARGRLPHNGIAVAATVEKDLPDVLGDENALADCVAHLVTNAVEACIQNPRPRIQVTAKPSATAEQTGVLITVEDNGKGIPEPIRDKVFSPFCTTKARGIGLGLPITKRTIIDHNGHIEIHTGQNGTAVAIRLPKANGTHRHETPAHH
jgi:PAS domain S-box-containing protein